MRTYTMKVADLRRIRSAMNTLPGIRGTHKEIGEKIDYDTGEHFYNFKPYGGVYADNKNTDLYDLHDLMDIAGETINMADDSDEIILDAYIYHNDMYRDLRGNVEVIYNTATKQTHFGHNIYD